MGTETAPVEGSGSWPSWMARVEKPQTLRPSSLFVGRACRRDCPRSFIFVATRGAGENLRGPTLGFCRRPDADNHPLALHSSFENLLRQIAFGGIRNDRHHSPPSSQTLRNFESSKDVGAAART